MARNVFIFGAGGMESLITWQTFQGVYNLAGGIFGKLAHLAAAASKALPGN